MEDMRPFPLGNLDSLAGNGDEKTSFLPSNIALESLKRYYNQDFGYNAKQWLDYILENDPDFVQRLNDLYGVEHSIQKYKEVLLDYDNRSEILFRPLE